MINCIFIYYIYNGFLISCVKLKCLISLCGSCSFTEIAISLMVIVLSCKYYFCPDSYIMISLSFFSLIGVSFFFSYGVLSNLLRTISSSFYLFIKKHFFSLPKFNLCFVFKP